MRQLVKTANSRVTELSRANKSLEATNRSLAGRNASMASEMVSLLEIISSLVLFLSFAGVATASSRNFITYTRQII